MANYSPVFVALLSLNVISQVKGQPTVQEQFCESGETLISMLTEIQQLRRTEAISQEKNEDVCGCREFLNASYHQLEEQQAKYLRSLQAVELRLQAQELFVQSIHEFLNASLQLIIRRLDDQDISIKNQTQISWKLAAAIGINDWVVILHRFDGSIDFYRNWTEYRNGFGDKERGEFWLGNEEVHRLTKRFDYTLRIEVQLQKSGRWYHAEYSSFSIDSESNKYKLNVSGHSGDAGDSFTNTSLNIAGYLDGMNFTTSDNDNDRASINCADERQGGWWYNWCELSCLTCRYNTHFFRWYSLNHLEPVGRLRAARMMIKSN